MPCIINFSFISLLSYTMNKQRNHELSMEYSHERRKHRTNVTTKAWKPDYRAIAGKSNAHNSLTIVDIKGNTILEQLDTWTERTKKDRAFVLGQSVAESLIQKNISSVVFDRNGYRYTGRVRSLAEGMRKGGIII